MHKRWFTILFAGPGPDVQTANARRAPDGNLVAWDGETTLLDCQDAAHKLAQKCQQVWVFVGKDIGRQIARYKDGVYVE